MLVLPTIILVVSGISGAGGLALSAKSMVDSLNASTTTRAAQERNDKNLLRFQAVSDKLNSSLEDLGRQRFVITNNFSLFIEAFEKIHNRPEFSSIETVSIPEFSFDEIKAVSVVAGQFLGASVGAVGGTVLAAAATSGTTGAIMALGTASTGAKIAELSGAAATKAALAALGGGSLAAGGGGIALGTLVLNAASLGVGFLIEGIAMAYAGSKAKKKADEMKQAVLDNEQIIRDAISMQTQVRRACTELKSVASKVNNQIYKPQIKRLQALVASKSDWNNYTNDEKLLVENTILTVQLLHHLNSIPLYIVTKTNEKGEVEEAEANTKQIATAISLANEKLETKVSEDE